MGSPRRVIALLVAILVVGVLGSVVQTQVSLAALTVGAIDVAVSTRLVLTIEDAIRFGPVMCAIAAAGLIPALVLGDRLTRQTRRTPRLMGLALLAAAAMWCVFTGLGLFTPMPDLVAATASAAGLAAMCATGLVGGLVFGKMTAPGVRQGWNVKTVCLAVALLAIPGLSFYVMAPAAGGPVDNVNPEDYRVQTIVQDLDRPWSLAFLPDGRLLVTEMAGRLLAISADGARSEIAIPDLPTVFAVGGVAGMMEVAVDPSFASTGWVYLTMSYGDASANGTRLVRGRLVDDILQDVRVLFSSTPKATHGNNGGRLAFLPDGTIVLTVGDGLAQIEAQNVANHLGSVVRLDRDGGTPSDNPRFDPPGAAPELYSIGHRNAQGIVYDPVTSSVLVSEHGPRGGDELNVVVAGKNYGWPLVTQGIDYSFANVSPLRHYVGLVDPLMDWTPSIAPSGLSVYQGSLFDGWTGDLLVPALKERSIRRVIREHGRIVGEQRLLAEHGQRIRDVRGAPDGAILVLTDGPQGKLLRLVPAR